MLTGRDSRPPPLLNGRIAVARLSTMPDESAAGIQTREDDYITRAGGALHT